MVSELYQPKCGICSARPVQYRTERVDACQRIECHNAAVALDRDFEARASVAALEATLATMRRVASEREAEYKRCLRLATGGGE